MPSKARKQVARMGVILWSTVAVVICAALLIVYAVARAQGLESGAGSSDNGADNTAGTTHVAVEP